MSLRFHLDEHAPRGLVAGLRQRGLDVTSTADADLLEADDTRHLTFARDQGRVLFTRDRDFVRLHARGVPHAGIAYCQQGKPVTIGYLVNRLAALAATNSAQDMRNRVEFL